MIAPDHADGAKRLPVVMVLHGLGSDRFEAASQTDLKAAVNEHGFIAVLPQGVANSWNAGPCCPPATLARIDDAGFLDRVLSEVRARSNVDPKRTYLVGFSNGGLLTVLPGVRPTGDVHEDRRGGGSEPLGLRAIRAGPATPLAR